MTAGAVVGRGDLPAVLGAVQVLVLPLVRNVAVVVLEV